MPLTSCSFCLGSHLRFLGGITGDQFVKKGRSWRETHPLSDPLSQRRKGWFWNILQICVHIPLLRFFTYLSWGSKPVLNSFCRMCLPASLFWVIFWGEVFISTVPILNLDVFIGKEPFKQTVPSSSVSTFCCCFCFL